MYKDDGYKIRKDTDYLREDTDFDKSKPKRKEEYKIDKTKLNEILVRQTMPSMENPKLDQLKLKSSKVIGSIFDRVIFLEKRITELNSILELRNSLHKDMISNIEKDIEDKNDMLMFVSDQSEKRNLKMDISVLRREKRHEQVQFWKDTTEIATELREIVEQYETEKKITSIFGDLDVQ